MLLNYIKIAWKVLLRHPFYTFITLFGISITLTVLMMITSFLDHLVGSHYPEQNRDKSLYIMNLFLQDSARTSQMGGPISYDFYKKYVETLKTPKRTSVSSMITSANSYINGKRIKVSTKYCDTNFWEITGYEFLEGKPFNQTNIANGDRVVVITDAMKEQFFDNSSESVIGKMVEVDNEKYKVIGVVKAGPVTRILTFSDMFFPYNLPKSNYQRTGLQGTFVAIIEANSASDFLEIRSEFDNNVSKIPIPINIGNTKYTIIDTHAQTYTDTMLYGVFHQEIGNKFYIVVGLVLLMLMGLPAINLVNLNVSRILERASEIGVRKAFGAPTRTLAFQFIVENIFITFIGGAIALIITSVGIYLFNRSGLILYSDLTINLPVFGVSLLVCLVFGLLSGVAPAFRMAKMKVIDALKRQ